MKIAYLVDKAAPIYMGGYEVRAQKLSAYLAKRHEVRVYTSMASTGMRVGEVEYVRVSPTAFQTDRSGQRSLIHSGLFAACLRVDPFQDWRPDAVIIESIPYAHLGVMRSWVLKTRRLYVLNVNEAWRHYAYVSGPLDKPSRWVLGGLLRRGIDFSTFVTAISEATSRSLKFNYSAGKIHTVPMGIDPEVLASADVPPMPDRKYDFVTMSRLVRIKRVQVFIDALSILKHHSSWIGKAAVIGEGPLRLELESRVRDLGLGSQVEFLGLLDGMSKYQAISKGRIFVLPSEREGFSIATLEAMALGLPAVVARPQFDEVFGTSEFVNEGVSGLFFPVGDSTGLARVLSTLMCDPDLVETLSRGAKTVASKYTWEAAGSLLGELLEGYLAIGL
jgi:glycosyltransferase involved in cell wall biosynthesis